MQNDMAKKDLGKRLREAMTLRNMTQRSLADRTKIPAATLSKIALGNQEGSSDVALLAHELGVHALWLSHGMGPRDINTDRVHSNERHSLEDVQLLQYLDTRCALGPVFQSEPKRHLPLLAFPGSLFDDPDEPLDIDNCFAYRATDSAVGSQGDAMLINTAQVDPRNANGKIFAIEQGMTLLIRKIYVSAIGDYRLSTDNTDKEAYPDEYVKAENVSGLRISGRVRYIGGSR